MSSLKDPRSEKDDTKRDIPKRSKRTHSRDGSKRSSSTKNSGIEIQEGSVLASHYVFSTLGNRHTPPITELENHISSGFGSISLGDNICEAPCLQLYFKDFQPLPTYKAPEVLLSNYTGCPYHCQSIQLSSNFVASKSSPGPMLRWQTGGSSEESAAFLLDDGKFSMSKDCHCQSAGRLDVEENRSPDFGV